MQVKKSGPQPKDLTLVAKYKDHAPNPTDTREDSEMLQKCREVKAYIARSLTRKERMVADLDICIELLERLAALTERAAETKHRIIQQVSKLPW